MVEIYHCFNTKNREECTFCNRKGGVYFHEEGNYVCPNDENEKLKHLGTEATVGISGISTKHIEKKERKIN